MFSVSAFAALFFMFWPFCLRGQINSQYPMELKWLGVEKAVFSGDGENAPYNGEVEHSINTDKARELGFNFTNLHEWIYELLDYFMENKS